MAKHTIREEMKWVVLFVGAIWVVFLLNCLPLPINLNDYGLRPRTLWGLGGNIYEPLFLHRDIWHLVSNTVPLFVLLSLLAGSRAASHWVVISLVTLGGPSLWVGVNQVFRHWCERLGFWADRVSHFGGLFRAASAIDFDIGRRRGVTERRCSLAYCRDHKAESRGTGICSVPLPESPSRTLRLAYNGRILLATLAWKPSRKR